MATAAEPLEQASDRSRPRDSSRGERRTVIVSQATGTLWFAGWLFTISFAQLVWWRALLGVALWPYYLGLVVR